MEKSKLAVIQDDILAVKHALANDIAFEGLEGQQQLNTTLSTLLAQRAAATAVEEQNGSASSGSGDTSSGGANSRGGGGSKRGAISRVPVSGAQQKAAGAKKTPSKSSKITPSTSSAKKRAAASKSPPRSKSKGKEPSHPRATSPPLKDKARPPPRSNKPAKKPRTLRANERLRQLRKDIKAGDTLSVLMDACVGGSWTLLWVKGEVVREMNRSGIFQVAFEHDRYGKPTGVKQEPRNAIEEKWIHEQRLQIDHPNFFCGHGDDPPHGVDTVRPRGAWYLHQASPTRRQRQAPAVPPMPCSRTPQSLSNGSGSGGSGDGQGSTNASTCSDAGTSGVNTSSVQSPPVEAATQAALR